MLALYDGPLRQSRSSEWLDVIDAASLLWRLSLAGIDVSERASLLSEDIEPPVDEPVYIFIDWHAVMVIGLAGRTDLADRVIAASRRSVGSNAVVAGAWAPDFWRDSTHSLQATSVAPSISWLRARHSSELLVGVTHSVMSSSPPLSQRQPDPARLNARGLVAARSEHRTPVRARRNAGCRPASRRRGRAQGPRLLNDWCSVETSSSNWGTTPTCPSVTSPKDAIEFRPVVRVIQLEHRTSSRSLCGAPWSVRECVRYNIWMSSTELA